MALFIFKKFESNFDDIFNISKIDTSAEKSVWAKLLFFSSNGEPGITTTLLSINYNFYTLIRNKVSPWLTTASSCAGHAVSHVIN